MKTAKDTAGTLPTTPLAGFRPLAEFRQHDNQGTASTMINVAPLGSVVPGCSSCAC